MNLIIRNYEEKDLPLLRECIIQLQDTEHSLEPDRLTGEEMVDKYLEYIFLEIEEKEGQIFVVEVDEEGVGIIAVRIEDKEFDLISKPVKCLYISDISVLKEYRGKGIGKALLQEAEEYAKLKNLSCLRLGVLPNNKVAKDLYEKEGFRDYEITMVKELN